MPVFNAPTMPQRITLPRRELQPLLRNVMLSGFASLEVHLPANMDVQLVVYLRGRGVLTGADGTRSPIPRAFVVGPSLGPHVFTVEPGSRFIAATFRPSGFYTCFGIPVDALAHALVPLDALFGARVARELLDALEAATPGQHQAVLEGFMLRQALPRQDGILPALPLDRLLGRTTALARELGLSTRQLERRFLIHRGLPLRDYRRLARFGTALASLMGAGPHAADLSRAAQEGRYVDQAHFARDFRQFVGDSPGRYARARGRADSPYHLWEMTPQELRSFIG